MSYIFQVRIEGSVEKMPEEKSEEYFKLRPRDSQISAIISPQSKPITSMQVHVYVKSRTLRWQD